MQEYVPVSTTWPHGVPASYVNSAAAGGSSMSSPGSSAASASAYGGNSYADFLAGLQSAAAAEQQAAAQASAERAMEFSAKMARQSYDLQRQARRTAYVDLVEGLKAAGLNPALALFAGSGATGLSSVAAPSGTSAAMSMANFSNENVAEEETKSKRDRDAAIWKAAIGLVGQIVTAGISAGAQVAGKAVGALTGGG